MEMAVPREKPHPELEKQGSKIEGVVIFDANSGIPLYSRLEKRIDPSLFTGFVSAARHFSNELSLGGLTSFTTEEKVIFLARKNKVITAIIKPQNPDHQSTVSLAYELAEQFESRFDVPRNPQPSMYKDFEGVVDDYIREIKNPFLSRVARFIHKQYGGEVAIKPRFNKKSGSQGVIDIVASTQEESRDLRNGISNLYSDKYTFVQAVDGVAKKGDIMEFLDNTDCYGVMVMIKDSLEFVPYFPSRAVVVARQYPEDLLGYLDKLPRDKGRIYIDGTHAFVGLGIKGLKRDPKCFVELWKWRDSDDPVRAYP
ncbi:MAG: hypothetical protein EAX81_00740 [Candidatus Thorarchaeota archaeon]|nr:hypothetical protein [Candidatus Thorarchaeota archaeon]